MAEVVGEAGGAGAVVAGPEGGLADADDAAALHKLVIVGRAADAVDVRVDVLHLRFVSVGCIAHPVSRGGQCPPYYAGPSKFVADFRPLCRCILQQEGTSPWMAHENT